MLRLRGAAAILVSVGLITCIAPAATAVTYTYTGNTFTAGVTFTPYTTSDFISGDFDLSLPLAGGLTDVDISADIVSFSVTDGVQTITDATFDQPPQFYVTTDPAGHIVEWGFLVIAFGFEGGIQTCGGLETASGLPSGDCALGVEQDAAFTSAGGQGFNESAPGSWTQTPEPSTALLLALGLGGLGVTGRRKRNRSTSFQPLLTGR